MAERWRDVPGYEGLYQVSDMGNVRSARRRGSPGGLLRPGLSRGYPIVSLSDSGEGRSWRVHQLVAAAFVGSRPEGMEVRHLNGVKTDCRVGNLSYGSASENAADVIRHGRNRNLAKAACPHGHPYDEGNTYRRPTASIRRYCRECNRVRSAAWRASRKGL